MDEETPWLSAEFRADVAHAEARRVDFFAMATREPHSHERNLARTSQVLVRSVVALRVAGVPVRAVCDLLQCSPATVQQVESRHPDLVVTLRARLGGTMQRTALVAAEELLRRLMDRPKDAELGELVSTAEKLGRIGAELAGAGGPATGPAAAEVGGYEAFLGALKRVREVPVDVESVGNAAKSEEIAGSAGFGAGAGVGEAPQAVEVGDLSDAAGQAKGGEGVGLSTGGGGGGSMQPGGENFSSGVEGNTHGVA